MATKKATEKPTKEKTKLVKLEALTNLTGVYLLPYSKGQIFSIDARQADELIANKHAKLTK